MRIRLFLKKCLRKIKGRETPSISELRLCGAVIGDNCHIYTVLWIAGTNSWYPWEIM